jgi:hypothetical protein
VTRDSIQGFGFHWQTRSLGAVLQCYGICALHVHSMCAELCLKVACCMYGALRPPHGQRVHTRTARVRMRAQGRFCEGWKALLCNSEGWGVAQWQSTCPA